MDKNFSAEVEISAPFNWGITDSVFGQDIKIELKGYAKDEKTEPGTGIISGVYSHKDGLLFMNCTVSGSLPDFLYIYISGK
jgi:hypothetical protein